MKGSGATLSDDSSSVNEMKKEGETQFLFLRDLPSKGTLTDLVEGSVLPKKPKNIDVHNVSMFRGCWRFECSPDPPLVTQLKRARRKKVAKTMKQTLGGEMQPRATRKRSSCTTPSCQTKRIKESNPQRTLLSICGGEVVTEDTGRTEARLRSMLKKELQDIALELDIQTRGTKQEILNRLMHRYHKDRRCFSESALVSDKSGVTLAGKGVFLGVHLDLRTRSEDSLKDGVPDIPLF